MSGGNQFREKEKVEAREQKAKSERFKNLRIAINPAGLLDKDVVVRLMPFIVFWVFLAIIYIANSYYAEKTIRELDAMNKELKELRSEYISTKSELMFRSKQSEVAKDVEILGVKEATTPPRKIIVKKED